MTKCLIEILYFDLYFSIFDFVFLYFCSLYTVNFDTNTNKFVCVWLWLLFWLIMMKVWQYGLEKEGKLKDDLYLKVLLCFLFQW